MQINGTTAIHPAQQIRGPHQNIASESANSRSRIDTVDQLDISSEANMISRAQESPEIRADRVASIKAQIADGTYMTGDKLDIALDRLMDEFG
ncbi:MAG: flagellar biosynthesis anti-sigma factor FlgM [Pirellulaceae bacterium]